MTRITLSDEMAAPTTRAVFAVLEASGGKGCVRFVGGCVRNLVMGKPISDLDLSTQLTPDETEAALVAAGIKSVPTGKDFGTITAVADGAPYEITSLREDVETDGRRAVVTYTTDWAKDAQRRDFYLNALYADIDGEVYDPTGFGLSDAQAGRVRFIGDAETRIREDYLRILRFFRFTAGYAAEIDTVSLAACVRLKAGIDELSGERIWGEISKMMGLAAPLKAFEAMQSNGIMPHVLPGWMLAGDRLPEFAAMQAISLDAALRMMALIDGGIGLAPGSLRTLRQRLKFSTAFDHRLRAVAVVVGQCEDVDAAGLVRLAYRHGRTAVADALYLLAAHAGGPPPEALLRHVAEADVPVFPIKGADLVARGMAPGPEVGLRLKQIETDWVNHDFSQSVIDAALDAVAKRPS